MQAIPRDIFKSTLSINERVGEVPKNPYIAFITYVEVLNVCNDKNVFFALVADRNPVESIHNLTQ